MSLKGNTATMPLDELLRFLDGRKSTGTLELIRGNAWNACISKEEESFPPDLQNQANI